MKYAKPPLSITDQLALIESRGLNIPDRQKAAKYLSNISYYRLSAYMLPFKAHGRNEFLPNVNFDDVLDLYLFDRQFRLLVFDAVERLEIAFRTQIIYHPSLAGGAFWFEDESNFYDIDRLNDHLLKLDEEVRRSGEVFIDHFNRKYTGESTPPAWMAFEVISLGLLSKFYQNLKISSPAKKDIARHFGINQTDVLQSWVRSMTYVRNLCAHHSRLWNRTLTNSPKILLRPSKQWITIQPASYDKIYYFLCCLLYMLREVISETSFAARLRALFDKYPKVSKAAMGFPANWETDKFWN